MKATYYGTRANNFFWRRMRPMVTKPAHSDRWFLGSESMLNNNLLTKHTRENLTHIFGGFFGDSR